MPAHPPDRARARGATEEFLQRLEAGGRHPVLHAATGVIRFEVREPGRGEPSAPTGEELYVILDAGTVRMATRAEHTDSVVRAERDCLDAMVEGRMNTTAALLRGALVVEGDLGLVAALSRLFPGPSEPAAPPGRAPTAREQRNRGARRA